MAYFPEDDYFLISTDMCSYYYSAKKLPFASDRELHRKPPHLVRIQRAISRSVPRPKDISLIELYQKLRGHHRYVGAKIARVSGTEHHL